jgi:hypothetical protein
MSKCHWFWHLLQENFDKLEVADLFIQKCSKTVDTYVIHYVTDLPNC